MQICFIIFAGRIRRCFGSACGISILKRNHVSLPKSMIFSRSSMRINWCLCVRVVNLSIGLYHTQICSHRNALLHVYNVKKKTTWFPPIIMKIEYSNMPPAKTAGGPGGSAGNLNCTLFNISKRLCQRDCDYVSVTEFIYRRHPIQFMSNIYHFSFHINICI